MIVCNCNGVSEKEIIEAIKKKGARELKHIQQLTGAATNCGKCIPIIDSLLAEHTPKSKGSQLEIDF